MKIVKRLEISGVTVTADTFKKAIKSLMEEIDNNIFPVMHGNMKTTKDIGFLSCEIEYLGLRASIAHDNNGVRRFMVYGVVENGSEEKVEQIISGTRDNISNYFSKVISELEDETSAS